MELLIGKQAIDGMLFVEARFNGSVAGLGETVVVTTAVPETDSLRELNARTAKGVRETLLRCLAALDAEYPQAAAQ